jgi:CRP-like cAMP-binding protein
MRDLTSRMLHLRQVPVVTMVSTPVLRELAASMTDDIFSPGERILARGEPPPAVILLTEGALSLTAGETSFGELKAPQTLGFLPILARTELPYDVTPIGEARALVLPADTLLDLMADHFELLAATLRYLAERMWLDFQDLPADVLGSAPVEMGPIPAYPIGLVPRILLLRKGSGLAKANVNALAVMARQLEEVRAPAGTKFWSPGDRGDRVLILVQGTILCEAADGRTFRYGTGTGVGGIESIAGRPRWYSATAETPVVGFWGQPEAMFDLFENQLRMAMDFIQMLARAQLGILRVRAERGHKPLASVRPVAKLGQIRYGA